MAADTRVLNSYLEEVLDSRSLEQIRARLTPHSDDQAHPVPGGGRLTLDAVQRRWELLGADHPARDTLADPAAMADLAAYQSNIENLIGMAKIPIGLAGPLRVNGLFASGDYYVPLATTEAALVASYSRGCQLMSCAGGCSVMLLNEGVARSPGFAFASLADAGAFVAWAMSQLEAFREQAERTTNHGKLVNTRITVEGNHVYLSLEFTTGDASGQNMVTLASEAICSYIEQKSPIKPEYYFIEANMSGDKKASAQSFSQVRGKKVSAEVRLPAALIAEKLRTSPQRMVDYWRMSAIGGVLSGTLGVQGHYANGLAALYIACGQDVACVAESAVGVTRMELGSEGELYTSVTLPNLIVGTVGGGTGLPSAKACLQIMGLFGTGKARALAEVCAGLCLAGELSIIGALCSGDFSRAHRVLSRQRRTSLDTDRTGQE